MSRRRKQLDKLVRLRTRVRDRAAAAHARDQLSCSEAETDHHEAVSALADLPTGQLLAPHELMRLTEVIAHHARSISAARARRDKSRAHLYGHAMKLRSAEELRTRQRASDAHDAARGEQKGNDELASQRHGAPSEEP